MGEFFGLEAGSVGAVAIPLRQEDFQSSSRIPFPNVELQITKNFLHMHKDPYQHSTSFMPIDTTAFWLALNLSIVRANPDIFLPGRIMTDTSCKMDCVATDHFKQVVGASKLPLKAEVSLELLQDLKGICGLDVELEVLNMLTDEISAGIRQWMGQSSVWLPYVPACPVHAVAFTPKVGFSMRGAIISKSKVI